MEKGRKSSLKGRILQLARLRSTGSPGGLAVRLGISERSVKRIIREMRDEGINLKYESNQISYVICHDNDNQDYEQGMSGRH